MSLLVEDEPNDVFLIERAFRKCNFQHWLHAVNDGEQAVAYLGGSKEYADRQQYPIPCLMLLDLKLPRRMRVLRCSHGCAVGKMA